MTGFDAYCIYTALHLHFSSDTYDYYKYHGKTRCSVTKFESRRDRYFFHKLARKFTDQKSLEFFLASNFVSHGLNWVRDSFTDEAQETYLHRKRIKESLEYTVQEDLSKMFADPLTVDNLKVLLRVENGEYPLLLTAMMHGDIHEETLIVLNRLIGFLPKWEKKIADTIIFPPLKLRLERYTPFLDINVKKFQTMLKSQLTNAK